MASSKALFVLSVLFVVFLLVSSDDEVAKNVAETSKQNQQSNQNVKPTNIGGAYDGGFGRGGGGWGGVGGGYGRGGGGGGGGWRGGRCRQYGCCQC